MLGNCLGIRELAKKPMNKNVNLIIHVVAL